MGVFRGKGRMTARAFEAPAAYLTQINRDIQRGKGGAPARVDREAILAEIEELARRKPKLSYRQGAKEIERLVPGMYGESYRIKLAGMIIRKVRT